MRRNVHGQAASVNSGLGKRGDLARPAAVTEVRAGCVLSRTQSALTPFEQFLANRRRAWSEGLGSRTAEARDAYNV